MAISQNTLITTAEFDEFIARPENADRLWELIDGKIAQKVPTEEHSLIAGNLFAALREFVRPRDLGRVLFEACHQLPNDNTNARLPDVEFTRKERLLPIAKEGGIRQMPVSPLKSNRRTRPSKGCVKRHFIT